MTTLVPKPPANWPGSIPEWHIYWALTRLGYKDGEDFTYQASVFGGRAEYGGAILDFLLPDFGIAINVQSTYYHYQGIKEKMADAMVRAAVESWGTRLIYIDEADALRAPIYYTKEALAGRDHSRMTAGGR